MVAKPYYTSPEEIQRGVDQYLAYFHLKHNIRDYRVKGRTRRRAGLPRVYVILITYKGVPKHIADQTLLYFSGI